MRGVAPLVATKQPPWGDPSGGGRERPARGEGGPVKARLVTPTNLKDQAAVPNGAVQSSVNPSFSTRLF